MNVSSKLRKLTWFITLTKPISELHARTYYGVFFIKILNKFFWYLAQSNIDYWFGVSFGVLTCAPSCFRLFVCMSAGTAKLKCYIVYNLAQDHLSQWDWYRLVQAMSQWSPMLQMAIKFLLINYKWISVIYLRLRQEHVPIFWNMWSARFST